MKHSNNRKKWSFNRIKNARTAKRRSSFKNFLKRTRGNLVAYLVKKGKQTFILIFSKEILIAVLVFVRSISFNNEPDVFYSFSPSSKVSLCCISESNNLEFTESLKSFKSPSTILDSILKVKGGSDD